MLFWFGYFPGSRPLDFLFSRVFGVVCDLSIKGARWRRRTQNKPCWCDFSCPIESVDTFTRSAVNRLPPEDLVTLLTQNLDIGG
jgi:hypothetical protein